MAKVWLTISLIKGAGITDQWIMVADKIVPLDGGVGRCEVDRADGPIFAKVYLEAAAGASSQMKIEQDGFGTPPNPLRNEKLTISEGQTKYYGRFKITLL